MHKRAVNCTNCSTEKIQEIINNYTSLGWVYIGLTSGFPGDMSWVHFTWDKESTPILPGQESNN